MKKIALCGTPDFVCKFFDAVYNDPTYCVEFIITQSAKQKARGYEVSESDIALWAKQRGIECFEIDSIKNGMTYDRAKLETRLAELDCVLLFAFGKIIPSMWLNLPKMGWLNVHPSRLPLLRGPSPIQYAILQRLHESAITLMVMDAGMDTGNIISQFSFEIREYHTANSLLSEICSFGPTWVLKKMSEYLNGKVNSYEQDGAVSYSHLIHKQDYVVTECDTVALVCAKIKAFGYVYFESLQLKCFACKVADENSLFTIKLIDGAIEPIYVQKPGKKIMNIRHFINGLR